MFEMKALEIIHERIRKEEYSARIQLMDKIIKEIKDDHPGFNPEKLICELYECIEKESIEVALKEINFIKKTNQIIRNALAMESQIKVQA
jgi:hypothetical protein